jgi:hypothetical protein
VGCQGLSRVVDEDDQDRSKYVGVMKDCAKCVNLTLVYFQLH